jgi:hypothetical protein
MSCILRARKGKERKQRERKEKETEQRRRIWWEGKSLINLVSYPQI